MPCVLDPEMEKPRAPGAKKSWHPGVPDMSAGSGGLAAQLKSLDGEAGDVATMVKSKKKNEPNQGLVNVPCLGNIGHHLKK